MYISVTNRLFVIGIFASKWAVLFIKRLSSRMGVGVVVCVLGCKIYSVCC